MICLSYGLGARMVFWGCLVFSVSEGLGGSGERRAETGECLVKGLGCRYVSGPGMILGGEWYLSG